MTFQETMALQAKKLELYLKNGGVNALPTRVRGSNGTDPGNPPRRMDAPCDNHSSESQILIDIAKAILLRED